MNKLFLLLTVVCMACQSQKASTSNLDAKADSILGQAYERLDNEDYVLYVTKEDVSTTRKTFLVLSQSSGEVVYGPQKLSGNVSWHTNSVLKIQEYPEVIQDRQSKDTFTYYFDVITKQRKELNENKL